MPSNAWTVGKIRHFNATALVRLLIRTFLPCISEFLAENCDFIAVVCCKERFWRWAGTCKDEWVRFEQALC